MSAIKSVFDEILAEIERRKPESVAYDALLERAQVVTKADLETVVNI